MLSTVVSTLRQSLLLITDVAVDMSGNVLMVSFDLNAVYRGFPNGSVALIAGSGRNVSGSTGSTDGTGGAARFSNPRAITCDVAANIAYVSDTYNHRIRRLDLNSSNVTTFAGSYEGMRDGLGNFSMFRYPRGIAHYAPSQLLYVADYLSNAVRKIDIRSTNVTTIATTQHHRCAATYASPATARSCM